MIALIAGIVGVAACQDPKARRNALIVLIISVIWFGAAFSFGVLSAILNPQPPQRF